MPKLTFDLLRENPWNVLTHPLPKRAEPLFWELAFRAAAYIRTTELTRMQTARDQGFFSRFGFQKLEADPDPRRDSGISYGRACAKCDEIIERYDGIWEEE